LKPHAFDADTQVFAVSVHEQTLGSGLLNLPVWTLF
jgi:hypothetical protein